MIFNEPTVEFVTIEDIDILTTSCLDDSNQGGSRCTGNEYTKAECGEPIACDNAAYHDFP